MTELILGIFENDSVPLETAICLSVIEYTQSTVEVVFVEIKSGIKTCKIKYKLLDSTIQRCKREEKDTKTLYTSIPAIAMDDGISYIAGLASVLRQIVKNSNRNYLLGFRNCCLAAPAEVSCWTRFCEVDIVNCVHQLVFSPPSVYITEENNLIEDDDSPKIEKVHVYPSPNSEINGMEFYLYYSAYLPDELATLEYHLSVPAKVHNRGKYGEGGPNHNFVEGPHIVLSDLIIAVCVHLIIDYLAAHSTCAVPFIFKWLKRIKEEGNFCSYLSRISFYEIPYDWANDWLLPMLENGPVDLYKKEGTRRKKIYTQGDLLKNCLEILNEVTLMNYTQVFSVSEIESIKILLPDVPPDRLERKAEQLRNLARATLEIAKDGDRIVDMCCGSGHLGILLAELLPACTIILLDNKEKSLERAKSRVEQLSLTNVKIVHSNLDYFDAKFQIGVSLHACGVASDLVIKKCLDSKAHLILCPCCYGGIQKNHIVKYPQSSTFQSTTSLWDRNYFVLAHNADTYNTEDGRTAMTAIDSDRCFYLSENGYEVSLSKLHPPECTTRNNLIIAVHSS